MDTDYLNDKYIQIIKNIQIVVNNISFIEKKKVILEKNSILHNKIIEIIKSPFTPEKILNDIQKNYIYYQKISFFMNNIEIEFNILDTSFDIDLKSIVIMAIKGLTLCHEFKNKLIDKIIKVYYIPTRYKKYLDNSHKITNINVNSGFTGYNYGKYIVIFRKEENQKVLLHELIHYLEIDFCKFNLTLIHNNLIKDFSIKTSDRFINLFEAYTDFIAIIYNSIINSIIYKVPIIYILEKEKQYQSDRTAMILNKFKMTHILKSKNKTKKKLNQETNVLSYYFLKSVLMDDYIQTINLFKLEENWNNDRINLFYQYIYSLLLKKEYLKFDINNNSLRMTCLYD